MNIVDQLKLMEAGKVTVFPRDQTIREARETIVQLRGIVDELRTMEAIERLEAEIERLRAALKQVLRQWHMYAEMVERTEGYDLAKEQSPEGDIYRATYAVAHEQRGQT